MVNNWYLKINLGQWSVENPTGKKVYSKSFLIQLGNEAICHKKPDVLRRFDSITLLKMPSIVSDKYSFVSL